MTKDQIKLLCETDEKLQWWAMVLFAEISELLMHGEKDDAAVWRVVEMKVTEFPKIVVHHALEIAKEKASKKV